MSDVQSERRRRRKVRKRKRKRQIRDGSVVYLAALASARSFSKLFLQSIQAE